MHLAGWLRPVPAEPVPRLWTAFACAWLPIVAFVGWLLLQQPLPAPRLALAFLGLLVFATLFA